MVNRIISRLAVAGAVSMLAACAVRNEAVAPPPAVEQPVRAYSLDQKFAQAGDGTVPAGLEDKAWLAQSNCPETAIEVIEE